MNNTQYMVFIICISFIGLSCNKGNIESINQNGIVISSPKYNKIIPSIDGYEMLKWGDSLDIVKKHYDNIQEPFSADFYHFYNKDSPRNARSILHYIEYTNQSGYKQMINGENMLVRYFEFDENELYGVNVYYNYEPDTDLEDKIIAQLKVEFGNPEENYVIDFVTQEEYNLYGSNSIRRLMGYTWDFNNDTKIIAHLAHINYFSGIEVPLNVYYFNKKMSNWVWLKGEWEREKGLLEYFKDKHFE